MKRFSEELNGLPPQDRKRLQRILAGKATTLDLAWFAPSTLMPTADPWQKELLSEVVTRREDTICVASRQIGKTEVGSLAAYLLACLGQYVLIVSPSDRQSVKFHERVLSHHSRLQLGVEIEPPNKHTLLLRGGGKIEAVPNSPDKIRGIAAVGLLLIDEAAYVLDRLYEACLPFLMRSHGKLLLLSTPFGERGFFYNEWAGKGRKRWRRHNHPWWDCPQFNKTLIEENRHRGQDWLDQEFGCRFLPSSGMAFFDVHKFEALITDEPAEEVAF